MNFLKLLSLLLTISIFTVSCSKEQGCTDDLAENYSISAEENDGSCTYQGSLIFFYEQAAADILATSTSVSLTYYLDGAVVGSGAASVYYQGDSAPECGFEGLVTTTKSWTDDTKKSFPFFVEDQDGFKVWEGNIELNAKTCTPLSLVL